MIVFYAPLYCEGETYGVLLGLYSAADYLRKCWPPATSARLPDVPVHAGRPCHRQLGGLLRHFPAGLLLERGVIDAQTAQGTWRSSGVKRTAAALSAPPAA